MPARSAHKESNQCSVVILAAGQGKRMRSQLPKVLHPLAGKPMIMHVLRQVAHAVPGANVAIIVGHGREQVEAAIRADSVNQELKIEFVVQPAQNGTGDAAKCALDSPWGKARCEEKANILILPGDLPLIPQELVRAMALPLGRNDAVRLLTCDLPNPTGYGRVVRRSSKGPVLRIVEERDSNEREKLIREVAASIYLFQSGFLRFGLDRIRNKNAQGEYYLTDLIELSAKSRKKIDILKWTDPGDLRGINDRWELSEARRFLNDRLVRHWAKQGVDIIDPTTTWLDQDVQIEEDVTIFPGCRIEGTTRLAQGSKVGPNAVLSNAVIGKKSEIRTGTVVVDSSVGSGTSVGPYAHLRPESSIGDGCKIGNFVELKKTHVGPKTSIAHLSYLGDAEVGSGVNIGCGFITCNFDGRVIDGQRKHRTVIEDDVFVGSDCHAVAPIRISKGAFIASGSTITENVDGDAMAIARARQVNKPGYARKLRSGRDEGK